ncbi:MAG TPA: hypothetical protein VGK67_08750 [Myxococcales bacterium]|jgi:hypothetical protein
MTKINRSDFIANKAASTIDLKKLGENKTAQEALGKAGMKAADVAKADLNKDGKVSGQAELNALFTQVDRFDKNGSVASVNVLDAEGNQTAAGRILEALDPTFQSKTQAIADAALDRIARFGKNYGVPGKWVTPNPKMPGNRRPEQTEFSATEGRWKCNLFAMDTLYQAGFVPASYKDGWYPIACDLHDFAKGPNRVFDQKGEITLNALSYEDKQTRVAELLKQAQPGDLIIVKHQGGGGSDGGHCRVVVGNNFEKDGTVACAQASSNEAMVRDETLGSFTGEDTVWLLRPCRTRE